MPPAEGQTHAQQSVKSLIRWTVVLYLISTFVLLSALLVLRYRTVSHLRSFQIAKCHADNIVRIDQRLVLSSLLSVLATLRDRTVVGLEPVKPRLLLDIQKALDTLPWPDQNCDGKPDPVPGQAIA